MSGRNHLMPLVVLSCLLLQDQAARAEWPRDPYNGNVAICTASGSQYMPQSISDGDGGAFIAWYDPRGGSYDIYAQRISSAGVPLWTTNGVAVCTAASDQYSPQLVADGNGGVIITWFDYRPGASADIYAQRINNSGTPQWAANGIALCSATNHQSAPQIASDGSGGAIVTWPDYRSGTENDVYAQRVDSSGTVQWTASGVVICTATNSQYYPTIVSDGAGGAIVTWYDRRGGVTTDIYAQRVSAAGTVQWTANGVALCTSADDQFGPVIVADNAGGAIVTWYDFRNGNYDIFAQRINSSGSIRWLSNGVALCTATGDQTYPLIASDSAGGAIVCWNDGRSGAYDTYAQRVTAGGVALWASDGAAICTAAQDQYNARIVADGTGGAMIAWRDYRGGVTIDMYAQRVSDGGAAQWTSGGVLVCGAAGNQDYPCLASDGVGGAIISWRDDRGGTQDIYCQRVERYGQLGNPEPVILSVSDVKNDQGGYVKLTWSASYLDADPVYGVYEYRVFRSIPGPHAAVAARLRGTTTESDRAVSENLLLVLPSGAGNTSWEYVGTNAAEAFAQYSRVVATASDSVASGNPLTWFMVEARASTSVSSDRWASAPGSGYSVDNLAPGQPTAFTGQYAAGTTHLHWNPNAEPDLAGYRLYRGSSAGFVPDPGNLVATPPDTGYVDDAGSLYFYKLTAVDTHNNESSVTTLLPDGAVDAGDSSVLSALSFSPPVPNPAGAATTLRFGLPWAAEVRLDVYDVMGRLVRRMVSEKREAGAHTANWDLRDDAGRAVSAGLYFVRLEVGGRAIACRVTVTR